MSFGDAVRKSMDTDLLDTRDPDAENAIQNGSYKVLLEDGSAFTSRKGEDYAKVTLTILEGPMEGRFEHFMGFNSPTQEQINGNACAVYGVDWTKVDSVTDLDLQMGALKGTTADVSVQWNGNFANVTVHGSRPPESAESSETTPAGAANDFASAASRFGDEPPF